MIATHATRAVSSQSPLELYLRQINDTPLLTVGEERDLAYRIEAGDGEARDHLVRANLRLVVNIARGYQNKGLDLHDLIAEGNFGLLRAAEAFDASMNTRFSTYAVYWVRQSIRRALINSARTIRLPAYMMQLLTEWRRASAQLNEEMGRQPTEEEIAGFLKLTQRKLRLIKKAMRIYNSMAQGEQEDTRSFDDLVADPRSQAPDVSMMQSDELHEVLRLVEQLDNREKVVLRLRFGLEGEEPKTLKQIGDHLGLTRERVRQIEREALAKLQDKLAAG